MERLFFGYAAEPSNRRKTLYSVASRIGHLPIVESSVSWEELKVDGRLIINEVKDSISAATVCVFDLTDLNLNVLFELGIALALNKRIIICRDPADQTAARRFEEYALLTTIGYIRYKSEDHLYAQLADAVTSSTRTLWDDLLRGIQVALDETALLYVPSAKEDPASRKLSRVIDKHGKLDHVTINLDDYGTMPLAWYVEEVYRCAVAIFHLTPSSDYLAERMNPRVALLAGISMGLARHVLFVAEESDRTAIDYRDMTIRYANPGHLERLASSWIQGLPGNSSSNKGKLKRSLANELASLRFGNHVAEGDQEGLERYFVETSDYREVVASSATIFTGKKGTGKTANMLQAADELRSDLRNLVCVIKPANYELESITEILRGIEVKHLGVYLIEALWKYLLYTEIASRAVQEAEARPAGIATGSALDDLRTCLNEKHLGVDASFSDRLESLANSLSRNVNGRVNSGQVREAREIINVALYGGTLRELRSLIASALSDRDRVAVLVDNLDKAWEKGSDLDFLAQLLLGLLTSVGRVVNEFHRENSAKSRVNVTLTVFLRSDIYAYIQKVAREPDKISVAEIEWRDPNLLARVLEDRFVAGRKEGADPGELWTNYFSPEIKGLPSREYLLSRVQRRPRDLVFLANAAVARAVNAKHAYIDEADVEEAEKQYSQFAYEALLVEGVAAGINLEEIIIEFAGERPILTDSSLRELLQSNPRNDASTEEIISILRRLGFLGIETGIDKYDYGGTEGEMKRADVLSRKLQKTAQVPARYEIHPAYRPFLEITDDGS